MVITALRGSKGARVRSCGADSASTHPKIRTPEDGERAELEERRLAVV